MADDVGEFRVRVFREFFPVTGETLLYVERADDRVFVAEEVLDHILAGRAHPNVSFGDGILTVKAINRTVSYGLVERDPYQRCWLAVKSPEITQVPPLE